MASIARTYDCSPPAISYVVSRSRARQPGLPLPTVPVGPAEGQLVKGAASEPLRANGTNPAAGLGPNAAAAATVGPVPGDAAAARREYAPRPEVDAVYRIGAERQPAAPPSLASPSQMPAPQPPVTNGDQRRTLHLSLGQPASGNGGAPAVATRSPIRDEVAEYVRQPSSEPIDRFAPAPAAAAAPPQPGAMGFGEMQRMPYPATVRGGEADSAHRKEPAFIDQQLRARVDGDIAAFLAAFDAALAEDTQQNRSTLREATDRLLRAGARTRIELERLEARLPLQPRDHHGRNEPAWRSR